MENLLNILNTQRNLTMDEWLELDVHLKTMSTHSLVTLYCLAQDKDIEVNRELRRENRQSEIKQRWVSLVYSVKRAFDHVNLRDRTHVSYILSKTHILDTHYFEHCKWKMLLKTQLIE